eukprot:g1658.t1
MRLDLTCQFQSDDSKLVGEFKSVSWCKSHVQRSGKRNGGAGADPKTRPFMTTPDAIANAARIDRGDKADEIDEALNHGRPVIRDAMAKQGVMTGIANEIPVVVLPLMKTLYIVQPDKTSVTAWYIAG